MAVAEKPKNELIKTETVVPQSDLDAVLQLDRLSKQAADELSQCGANEIAKAIVTSRAMTRLRQMLSDAILQDIMQLQNTALGFKTDHENGYSREVVRDVMVQAFLRGLRATGNEINIIAGNLYVTVDGFARLIREMPGLTNFRESIGVHVMVGDRGALVPASASWRLNGIPDSVNFAAGTSKEDDFRLAIRVNKGMGADAIKGKARSKLYRAAYRQMTGSDIGVDNDNDAHLEITNA